MLSIIVPTYRPGGIDILAKALPAQVGVDYELILVDDYQGRVERKLATDYLNNMGVKLGWHGVSKPHSVPSAFRKLTNAVNTGFMHAKGDRFWVMHDYTLLPHIYSLAHIEQALDLSDGETLIHGVAILYSAKKPDNPGDIVSWEDGEPVDLVAREPWVPEHFEGFYFGGPMRWVEDINGIDERADHCGDYFIRCVVKQAERHGYRLKVNRILNCGVIDHRRWNETPGDGQWRLRGEPSSGPEPDWRKRSPNPYDLKAMRAENTNAA